MAEFVPSQPRTLSFTRLLYKGTGRSSFGCSVHTYDIFSLGSLSLQPFCVLSCSQPSPQEPALEPQRALLLIPEPVSRLRFFVNNTGLISQDESKFAINIGGTDDRYRTNGNAYVNPASPAVARFLQLSKTAWTIQQIDAL